MTGEETKQLKDKFKEKFYDGERFFGREDLWQFIQDEIITPYEKQLEQVEREILLFRNSGFKDDSPKVLLGNKYNEALLVANQQPLSEQDKYDFYRGIEYACDHLLKSQNTQTK